MINDTHPSPQEELNFIRGRSYSKLTSAAGYAKERGVGGELKTILADRHKESASDAVIGIPILGVAKYPLLGYKTPVADDSKGTTLVDA